jgi:simple sugar transport system ATP-binding protein
LIEELPVGLQQRVEILKALYRGADILILDEPTGVLTPAEADHLFRILQMLKDQGKTVILITHKLREIMAITDNVSVMRQGTMVATRKTKETTVSELAELMVGRRVLLRVEKGEAKAGEGKAVREEPDGEGFTQGDDGRQCFLRHSRRRDRRHCRCRGQWPVGADRGYRRHPPR